MAQYTQTRPREKVWTKPDLRPLGTAPQKTEATFASGGNDLMFGFGDPTS